MLAARFRVVALLGRGGMGEVYRADDLTLGQPVALKFLPAPANTDEHTLARLRDEVRIARRVSHPNVCRVYDVGEAQGSHFLSMEYVDGEDLATLLKRIGRLPLDKALEVARKICAGLSAAHEKGILHRDLKPANIMLDRQGQVVITDFGLASLADQGPGTDIRSGTPAFMAPEQLDNTEVTAKSDIYALGLVLYEIFTGKRPFEVRTFAEAVRSRRERSPAPPTSVVADLDPAVERVILRCLERDPASRPPTALAVAAALPGGDPLAAALAAGETPAPQVVADAGKRTGFTPRAALTSMAAVVAGLAAVWMLAARGSGLAELGLEAPPEVLAEKAREIIKRLGYDAPPADTARGFSVDDDLIRYLEANDKPRPDWKGFLGGRPSLLSFWYRTSPRELVVLEFGDDLLTPGVVTPDRPSTTLAGMVNLRLDARGRLTYFQALPPEKEEPSLPAPAPDWGPLLAAAELEMARLEPTPPAWTSLAASDSRAAWKGTWPGTSQPLRVESAAWHGKPVFFALIGPWTRASRMEPSKQTGGEKARDVLGVSLILSVLAGAALLARRNLVRGRGDRRGAFRLAALVFCLQLVLWLCRGHQVVSGAAFLLLLAALADSLLVATVMWLLYLALEPYVRRHWPRTIVSWSRLLAGRFRDPLVGRDVVLGVLLGLVWALIFQVNFLVREGLGAAPPLAATDFLQGLWPTVGAWLKHALSSIRGTLDFFFLLFVLRAFLRREWLAGVAFVLLFSVLRVLGADHPAVEAPTQLMIYAIAVLMVLRFGLVTLAVGILTIDVLIETPATSNFSAWYAGSAVFVFLSILALGAWGAYTSLGGQRLWTGDLFE